MASPLPAEGYRRRSTDQGEPSNADILERFSKFEQKFDSYLADHARDHRKLDVWVASHDAEAEDRQHRIDELATEAKATHDKILTIEVRDNAAAAARQSRVASISATFAALGSLATALGLLAHMARWIP